MKKFAQIFLTVSVLTVLAVNGGFAFDRIVLFENFTNSN